MAMLSKLLLSAICLACILVAAWAVPRELAVQSILGRTWNDRIAALAALDGTVPRALSVRSTRNLVTACAEMGHTAPLLRGDPALAGRFRATCARIAQAVLQTAPTHARARAMALIMAPMITAADLARAQASAPSEPWPLRMRLWALAGTGALDVALLDVAKADFDRALRTDWGRALLARLYLDRAEVRTAILARAEATDPRIQRAFLAAVEHEQRGGRALDFTRG